MSCEYVREYYGVPAVIGRRVIVDGEPGIIAKDCGHYIGVNFDKYKPGHIHPCHPTWKVEYGDMGEVRKMTHSQARYQRYLDADGAFGSFIEFCRADALRDRGAA